MSQITLRGLDPELEKEIRKGARKSGKSLNRFVLEMIGQRKVDKKMKGMAPASSLRELAGGWSEKDAEDFLASIKSCEQIDDEMWR